MPEHGKGALTPWEIAARRRNARKSTGPRTPRGKRRAALNALRAGWYAKRPDGARLFFRQDPPEFRRLHCDLIALLDPAGPDFAGLVRDLALDFWLKWHYMENLQRCARLREPPTPEHDTRIEEMLGYLRGVLSARSRKWYYRLTAVLGGPIDSLADLRARIESRLAVFQELAHNYSSRAKAAQNTQNKGSLTSRGAKSLSY